MHLSDIRSVIVTIAKTFSNTTGRAKILVLEGCNIFSGVIDNCVKEQRIGLI
jgi:hypothetical protein